MSCTLDKFDNNGATRATITDNKAGPFASGESFTFSCPSGTAYCFHGNYKEGTTVLTKCDPPPSVLCTNGAFSYSGVRCLADDSNSIIQSHFLTTSSNMHRGSKSNVCSDVTNSHTCLQWHVSGGMCYRLCLWPKTRLLWFVGKLFWRKHEF